MVRIGVIGGGVVGTLIAREACRYDAEVHLFESRDDVAWGVTKANSAIVHGGFHDTPGTVRARFCRPGNDAYPALCDELDVPFQRTGAYVLAFTPEQVASLDEIAERGERNAVPDLQIHAADEVLAREPNVNPSVQAGLWSPTVGITEPWALAIAATENAQQNGLHLHLAEEVVAIEVDRGHVRGIRTIKDCYDVDVVINAAGLYADRVAVMAGLPFPELFPRRGEYVLLDKRLQGTVNSVLFPSPSRQSKGILVLPTIDGGILIGPNAEDLPADAMGQANTTALGLEEIVTGARQLIPSLDFSQRIKTFAGLRPETLQRDFIVGETAVAGFYQAAAMRSPGLTAIPSLAPWLVAEVAQSFGLKRDPAFDPQRRAIPKPSELDEDAIADLIARDPRYGRVICFCNEVTEGEVVEAIRRGARSIDAVKFRTRAGFGRCQGGSCTVRILQILARELATSPQQIPLNDPSTWLVSGEVRS